MVNTTLVKHYTCYTSTACATYGMNLARAHSLFWFLQNFFYTALVLFTNTRSQWAFLQPLQAYFFALSENVCVIFFTISCEFSKKELAVIRFYRFKKAYKCRPNFSKLGPILFLSFQSQSHVYNVCAREYHF